MVVKVIADLWFEKVDPDGKDFIRMLIAFWIVVFGLVGYIVYDFLYYPMHFWGFVGYHLRWVGYVAITGVGFAVLITTKGYGTHKTVWGQVLGLTYTFILLAMLAGWYYLTIPSKPLVAYPDDYAAYINDLWKKVEDRASMLVIAAGWLAGVMKLIGWTEWSTSAETIGELFKKKD